MHMKIMQACQLIQVQQREADKKSKQGIDK